MLYKMFFLVEGLYCLYIYINMVYDVLARALETALNCGNGCRLIRLARWSYA